VVLDANRVTDSHRDFTCDDFTKTGVFNLDCGAPPPPPPPPPNPPATGPSTIVSTVKVPATGPSTIVSTVKVPATGPSTIVSTVKVPATGPSTLVSTVKVPATGPSTIVSTVKVPATGPGNLTLAIDPPDTGPSTLVSTVVIPTTGPSSLGASVAPPVSGPGSLDAVNVAPFNISPYLGNSYDTEDEIFALQSTAPDGLVAYNESTHTLYIWVATQSLWHKFVWEFNIAPLEASQDNFVRSAPVGNDNVKFAEDVDHIFINDGTDWHQFKEE